MSEYLYLGERKHGQEQIKKINSLVQTSGK